MDMMYLPESIAYQTRYYSYEQQPWVNINEKETPKKEKISCNKDGKNCSICKDRQKRVLSNYIRKTRRDSDRETCIEEEEEEEEVEGQKNLCEKPGSGTGSSGEGKTPPK